MARLPLIREPGDDPAPSVADLFAALFPGNPAPAFDQGHSLMAVLAHSPKVAEAAAKLSAAFFRDSAWGQRAALRELAFQTLGRHFGDAFSTEVRKPSAETAGLTAEQLAALPDWRRSDLFDEEQRLVIEYTQAVVTGRVASELFARVVARYGEQEAVECTAAIGFWSFWAMVSGAAGLSDSV
jgi:alkylhydroperoxidase family enzyme